MNTTSWIDLNKDAQSGIETLRAHFKGHAYDPHWHDSYLVGFTEQGVQRFSCRRERHCSTPGTVFLLEPGEIHDGDAPSEEGFTYQMLYIEQHWLDKALGGLFENAPTDAQLSFARTLSHDPLLAQAIAQAFRSLHDGEMRMVNQAALDNLLTELTRQLHWRSRPLLDPRLPLVAHRARDFMHAHGTQDIGLDDLAKVTGVDRFRLTRAFKQAYGLSPHAYLVQWRLAQARQRLAAGEQPADVAMALGFADQSHLGRWFQRAYRLTPADYRKRCSNLPD